MSSNHHDNDNEVASNKEAMVHVDDDHHQNAVVVADVSVDHQEFVMTPMDFEEDDDKGIFQGCFSCCSRRKDFWTFAGAFALLVVAVGGLIFVLYDHPALVGFDNNSNNNNKIDKQTAAQAQAMRQKNDAYYRELRQAVIHQVYNGWYNPSIFLQPNSPQRLAMEWMAYIDTLHLPLDTGAVTETASVPDGATDSAAPTTSTASIRYVEQNANGADNDAAATTTGEDANTDMILPFRWIQRYALMTIYFANGGGVSLAAVAGSLVNASAANTNNNTTGAAVASTWAEQVGIHECRWLPTVACDEHDHIMALSLVSNTLSGNIPKEIGLLSYLKYLDLAQNRLTGRLPTELYDLTGLSMYCICVTHDCWRT